ncbi:MAG: three-Cys-motif partner protein TcmP [Candidatus Thorarchaeota archaeon]
MLNKNNSIRKSEFKYKIIKPHSKQKYIFLGGIFHLISRITKRDFVFIDLYCGEGLCKCDLGEGKISDEEILGSPLLLLEKFNEEPYKKYLKRFYCNDKDKKKIDNLRHWINTKHPNLKDKIKYLQLDAKSVWKNIKSELLPNQGIIIIIDPDNISQMLSYKLLKEMAGFSYKDFLKKSSFYRRPELIINFMQYGLTRSWESISSNKLAEITGISITEIEDLRVEKRGKEFADSILNKYKSNIAGLGYKTVISYPVLNVENLTDIYHIILASNHPSAPKLYQKITDWAEKTKSLNILTEKAHKKGDRTLDEF